MITIFNNRLLLLIGLILSIGFLSSCDKNDDDVKSSAVQLLSFGPTGAKHGDTLRFFGNNLNKVTEVVFTGKNATVAQKDFKQQTDELILLIVPKAAEKGFVTLKAPEGDVVSKTKLNLDVTTTVTTITREARPGENITITGDYLNWVKSVTFARDKVVTSFVSQAQNQLVVAVPEDAQTGPLVLYYTGTDSAALQTADTLKVTLPIATTMAPNPVKHQTDLVITGTNLDLVKQVKFTNVTAPVTTFVRQSATELVVKVPASTKKGKITLVAASGVTTTSTQDLDIVMPAITAVSPNPVDPGANLTVTGTNLDLVDSIKFQNAPAVKTFVSKTADQIVVTVPNGVLNGLVTFYVKNSTLTVASPAVLEITGAAPPPTIARPIYNDAVTSNWTGWVGDGWGGTRDYNNTAPVREGAKSIKVDYVGGWGSPFQLGNNAGAAGMTIAPSTTFKISIYGAAGSGGKVVNVGINGRDGYNITVVEGKWTDYEIPVGSLTTDAAIKEIIVKNFQGTGGYTIYIDAVGLN
jgi:hypothetical protein